MAEVWLSRLTLPWPWRKFLVRSKQTSLQQESASLLCQLSTCQLSLIIKSNFHPNSCRSLFLSKISPGNKKDCPATACLAETMTIWRRRFHYASMTTCKSSSQIAAVRTVEGQKITVNKDSGRFWLHITENFSPKGIGTQRSCPLRFARPTWATPGCIILVQIQCWPCLQQEVRLQNPEVPFYWHNDGFNIAGISVFLQDLKGHWY